jgi:heavy metal sensor kinase
MPDFFRRTRVRLTLIYASLFLVVAGIAAGGFWIIFVEREYGIVDDSLQNQADVIAATLPRSAGSGPIDLPSGTLHGAAIASYLFLSDGTPVTSDAEATDFSLAKSVIPKSGFPERSTFSTIGAGHGDYRVLVRRVTFAGQTGGIVLERPTQELDDRLVTTAVLLSAIVGILVIVACALAYWLSGRALSPVREMAATARDISEHDLHRRIRIDLPESDELGELARTFNDMLSRLEVGFQALQQFTADAAHELRAPLALIRAQVEIAQRQPRSSEAYRATNDAVLAEVSRMSRTVEHLLLLARADAGELHAADEVFDLPDLLEETVARWGAVAVGRSVELRSAIPANGEMRGDRDLLRRLLDNLVDNAIRHASEGGQVELQAQAVGDQWEIAVSDSGPGVSPGARSRIFERFYREDKARRRGQGNAGLGLALSKTIAELHGGRIWLADAPSELGGARFVVRIPRPPASAPPLPGRRPPELVKT